MHFNSPLLMATPFDAAESNGQVGPIAFGFWLEFPNHNRGGGTKQAYRVACWAARERRAVRLGNGRPRGAFADGPSQPRLLRPMPRPGAVARH